MTYVIEDEETINAVYEAMIRRYDEMERMEESNTTVTSKPRRPQTIDYGRSARAAPTVVKANDAPRRTGSVSGLKSLFDAK